MLSPSFVVNLNNFCFMDIFALEAYEPNKMLSPSYISFEVFERSIWCKYASDRPSAFNAYAL